MSSVNVEVTDSAGNPTQALDREMRLRGFSHKSTDGPKAGVGLPGVYRTGTGKGVTQVRQIMQLLATETGRHFRFRIWDDADAKPSGGTAWVEV